MRGKKNTTLMLMCCIGLLASNEPAHGVASFWQESERKAISLQSSDTVAAIEMYRLAIKDATSENAPVEKRLGLLLGCGNLLYSDWQSREAAEMYQQGADLAQENGLKNWQA